MSAKASVVVADIWVDERRGRVLLHLSIYFIMVKHISIYFHYDSGGRNMEMQAHCSGRSYMHLDDGYAVKKCARMIVVLSEISKSMF
jgi:hypothetical protein